MPKTVILGAARTPIGKLGGGLASLDATELGGTAIKAALERADVERRARSSTWSWARCSRPARARSPRARRRSRRGIPKEVSSETINKVCASGIRAAGHARRRDPRRRHGGRRGRRHGVDVQRALPAPAGPLRLPHGRRQGDRRDDPGRPAQPLLGPADVRGGRRGGGGARAHPRRHGPLGAALPRAGHPGDRRGPAARGDRAGHREGQEGRHGRGGRRGPAPRELAGEARQAARRSPARAAPHGRQLARRQRRRRRAGGGLGRVGEAQRQAGRWPRSSPRRRSPTTSPTWRERPPRPPRPRSRRSACRRRTSTSGRSTRPSPRSR